MDSAFYASIDAELRAMAQADQEMRTRAMQDMSLWDGSVDYRNTARLKEIIAQIGWPTISKVGVQASHDAWLLAQHATADVEFMRHCLTLMKSAAKDDVALANIAFLRDRLLTMEDKPQLYGTQFRIIDGKTEAFPIQDPEHLDERRADVGLDTFAENEARVRGDV